jgi:hypothetical protein
VDRVRQRGQQGVLVGPAEPGGHAGARWPSRYTHRFIFCVLSFFLFFADEGSFRFVFRRRRRGRRGKCSAQIVRASFFPHFSFLFFLQTHPQQNMIASGSIDSDLTIKVWVDRGSS